MHFDALSLKLSQTSQTCSVDRNKPVIIKETPHNSRYGPHGSVRRMSAADQRQIPAQGHWLSLAWGVRALRGVRRRTQEVVLRAGPQTLLQTGLCWVSRMLFFIIVWL